MKCGAGIWDTSGRLERGRVAEEEMPELRMS